MDENDWYLISKELNAKSAKMTLMLYDQAILISALGEVAKNIGDKLRVERRAKESVQDAWDQR